MSPGKKRLVSAPREPRALRSVPAHLPAAAAPAAAARGEAAAGPDPSLRGASSSLEGHSLAGAHAAVSTNHKQFGSSQVLILWSHTDIFRMTYW